MTCEPKSGIFDSTLHQFYENRCFKYLICFHAAQGKAKEVRFSTASCFGAILLPSAYVMHVMPLPVAQHRNQMFQKALHAWLMHLSFVYSSQDIKYCPPHMLFLYWRRRTRRKKNWEGNLSSRLLLRPANRWPFEGECARSTLWKPDWSNLWCRCQRGERFFVPIAIGSLISAITLFIEVTGIRRQSLQPCS